MVRSCCLSTSVKRKQPMYFRFLMQAREAGIRAEIYPDSAKMKKQMGYANSKNIPFVALVGETEMNEAR